MPIIRIYKYSPAHKKSLTRFYNTDAAELICQTPMGKLLKKKRKCNFYIYNPKGKTKEEQITELTYKEAKELVKTHGTKEQYCKYFSILDANGNYKSRKKGTTLYIDEVHAIKLFRSASALSMTPVQCIQYLIDKYDDMGHFNLSYTTVRTKNQRTVPGNLTDLT